jgi:glycosyltransferase involved in cell wall biosynthesis
MNFAIYYAGDAYSTDKKIMGRQSAGKAFINGLVRACPEKELHGFGPGAEGAGGMIAHLKSDGFKGQLTWHGYPAAETLQKVGAIYYPAPPSEDLAFARNALNPASYSLFGVTHTLSSDRAMDGVAGLILSPFQSWDALICTSNAAHSVVKKLQSNLQDWMKEYYGATKFNNIQLPVIPLGINAPSFNRTSHQIKLARDAMSLQNDEVVFLFAGRLTFHAKANPVAFYQAIEKVALRTGKNLVCLEAGVFPNSAIQNSFKEAQKLLAPSVRFIWIDGQNETNYMQAWKASDVFVSLSDNIQETFGLTPLEAMAAGMPVIVSDWDGYKDTVRDGIDGYRIPVTLPPIGAGRDLATRYAAGQDSYDMYIGRASMAAVVDQHILAEKIELLTLSSELRIKLGESGRLRANHEFDWPIIIRQYETLVDELREIRQKSVPVLNCAWKNRPDPFYLFSEFSTDILQDNWGVSVSDQQKAALAELMKLKMCSYTIDSHVTSSEIVVSLHALAKTQHHSVKSLLDAAAGEPSKNILALMWLYKFDLLTIHKI